MYEITTNHNIEKEHFDTELNKPKRQRPSDELELTERADHNNFRRVIMAESNSTPEGSVSQEKISDSTQALSRHRIPQGKIKGKPLSLSQHTISQTKPHNTTSNQALTRFTLKEIKTLQIGQTQIKYLTLIQTQRHPKPRYQIQFTLHTHHNPIGGTLITTRNKPYQLAHLDRGIQFLQKVFVDLEAIEVRL